MVSGVAHGELRRCDAASRAGAGCVASPQPEQKQSTHQPGPGQQLVHESREAAGEEKDETDSVQAVGVSSDDLLG